VLVSIAVYLVALGVAVAAAWALAPTPPLAAVAVGDLAATLVVFVASLVANNSSMYDPYWSLAPAAIAAYYLTLGGHGGARGQLVAGLVALYAVRLTGNFYRGWPGLAHEDWRYVAIRRRSGRLYWPVSLLGIHLFPTAVVYLGCLPLYGAMGVAGSQAGAGPRPLGWFDALAGVVTLAAVVLAFVADEQLRAFRRDPAHAGESMRRGVWRRSRHPNYLGEIATWWGFYLFALAAGGRWWWTIVGPLAVTCLFVFVTAPMMERRALATRREYAAYRSRTPMLLPYGRGK
jgi:steroid 5-alpha reductase family enzyme